MEQFLDEVSETLRPDVESNYVYQRKREFAGSGKHEVEITKALLADFAKEWSTDGRKLEMVPAKDLIHGLNAKLAAVGGRSVSSRNLSNNLRLAEIDEEMIEFLGDVENMLY